MRNITFLIRSLHVGGAERQLVNLARCLAKSGFNVSIIVFYSGGELEDGIYGTGLQILSLDKKSRWDIRRPFHRLLTYIKQLNPEILHTYLSTSNLLSVFLKPFLKEIKIVWGVRASNMRLEQYDWLSNLIFRLECLFSRYADLIIVNSFTGRDYHVAHGFPIHKIEVIPNGIDVKRFSPNPIAKKNIRDEWKIPDGFFLIGLVGRLDPIKDHSTFLKAAKSLSQLRRDVKFVCVGSGKLKYARKLHELGDTLGLQENLTWIDTRQDVEAVYNAVDIITLTSSGEGFPNVVAEAMACGVPCVVTDVGDAALIVGETGIVIPPQSPEALAEAWNTLIGNDGYSDPQRIRQRVVENFSLEQLSAKTIQAISR